MQNSSLLGKGELEPPEDGDTYELRWINSRSSLISRYDPYHPSVPPCVAIVLLRSTSSASCWIRASRKAPQSNVESVLPSPCSSWSSSPSKSSLEEMDELRLWDLGGDEHGPGCGRLRTWTWCEEGKWRSAGEKPGETSGAVSNVNGSRRCFRIPRPRCDRSAG